VGGGRKGVFAISSFKFTFLNVEHTLYLF
jgi:hypothetical protein